MVSRAKELTEAVIWNVLFPDKLGLVGVWAHSCGHGRGRTGKSSGNCFKFLSPPDMGQVLGRSVRSIYNGTLGNRTPDRVTDSGS